MDETNKTVYKEYLIELNEFEQNLQESTLELFEQWKEKVINSLDRGQKIRFSRLEFYEETANSSVYPPFEDDLPF